MADLLTVAERDWLNAYHAKVLEILGPEMTGEELAWLDGEMRAYRLGLEVVPTVRAAYRLPAPGPFASADSRAARRRGAPLSRPYRPCRLILRQLRLDNPAALVS